MPLTVESVATKPFDGQKPGTSGLRKKVKEVTQPHYLENFVQAIFDSLPHAELKGAELVVAGDGRYYNDKAMATIIRIAAANGVGRIVTGLDYLMSTPNVSQLIRERKAYGGIILTASHNPGGPTEDFGIKYNCQNGGPAPEGSTNAMFENSKNISLYKITKESPEFDEKTVGVTKFGDLEIVVVDAPSHYLTMCKSIFDFESLRSFVAREDFSMTYDSMHGVAGPFARKIFDEELKMPGCCINSDPKSDFGGSHPDPNLTYAKDLVEAMGLGESTPANVPEFGAAADGDADRNMVLGKAFFVTPSDSVAIIAANAQQCIPYFKDGLKGVARSMPTSAALDRVASKLNVECFEVPTGWKFFGNLMDAGKLSICGEESFGTGSDHIREKDGAWAVLCWLSILAHKNKGQEKLVSVEDIVRDHWKEYGRNYYSRYDYEAVDKGKATEMMAHLVSLTEKFSSEESKIDGFTVAKADEFTYHDPVDKSVSAHQGIRFIFSDGSRVIFRLSGTGSVGATIRLYVERYETDNLSQETAAAVAPLIKIALELSKIEEFTGREKPTVIT